MTLIATPFLIPIFLILIGIFFDSLFGDSFKKPLKIFFYFIIIYIIIIAGSRYKFGPDWPGYDACFQLVKLYTSDSLDNLSKNTGFEKGYILFNLIFINLGFSYWTFNLFFAGISIFIKSQFMFKYSKFIFLSLLLYYIPLYFFEDMVQIRQGFATGITLLSIKYIIDKKVLKFLFCIFLAFQFHKSAIIFVFAYWIGNSNIKFQYFVITSFISILIFPIGLSKKFTFLIDYIPIDAVKNGFNSYSKTFYTNELGFSFGDIVKISYLFLIISFNKLCIKEDEDGSYKVLRNLYLIAIILYFFFHDQVIFASRLINYYTCVIYILAPLILYRVRSFNKSSFLILLLLILIYQFLLYIRFSDLHSFYLLEYTNYIYPTESNK